MQTQGMSALVTGASRGIGRAIALRLAKDGYAVVANYAGSKDMADSLVREIELGGGRALAFCADVSDLAQAKELIEAAEAFAPIGALVNNAGIAKDGLVMRMNEDDLNRVLDVNLKGAFHTLRYVSPLMMRRRMGSIVSISSVVGSMGNAGQSAYAAAKAGLLGLTKSAARELAPRGVTVNAVLPGYIETDMTAALSDGVRDAFVASVPLGRAGSAQDVAEMVAFLCGAGSRYITGHEFFVDGGLRM